MGLIESHWTGGIRCDARNCGHELRLPKLVPALSQAERDLERQALSEGWARRSGRSVNWFCPTDAHRAARCIKGKYGVCSPWCPVHKNGAVWTSPEQVR